MTVNTGMYNDANIVSNNNAGQYSVESSNTTMAKANPINQDIMRYMDLISKRKRGSPLTLDEMNFISKYESRPNENIQTNAYMEKI